MGEMNSGLPYSVMEDQINKKVGLHPIGRNKPCTIKVDSDMKYDKFLTELLEELDDKDEFGERFDDYLKDELDKYKRGAATIEEKVKTILDCFKENASHFDEDNLSEAKEKILEYYPEIYKIYF